LREVRPASGAGLLGHVHISLPPRITGKTFSRVSCVWSNKSCSSQPEGWVRELASLLFQRAAVYRPHDRSGRFDDPSGVCIRTINSAKGLQWRAVLVMRCDMMPFLPEANGDRAEQEHLERGLMYVAMTRAEEMLAFTRSSSNGFASRIEQLLEHSSAG